MTKFRLLVAVLLAAQVTGAFGQGTVPPPNKLSQLKGDVDVITVPPVANVSLLKWNGTKWVPGTAPAQVSADWNASSGAAHILNKPTALSAFSNDAGYLTGITSLQVTGALGFTPYNATNPANYIAASGAPVQSVAGRGGNVVLVQGDVSGLVSALAGKQATITTGSTAQYFKGDLSLGTFPTALSAFSNDTNFITAAGAPVQSVAGRTGAVTLSPPDIFMTSGTILGRSASGDGIGVAYPFSTIKTFLALNNVENTALSTWGGSANITTLGTIATGSIPASLVTGIPTQISSLSLATPNVLYTTPVTFNNTSGAWSGTLALNTQTANTVFAGPTTGAAATPTFRALVAADIPTISGSQVTGGTFGAVNGSALTNLTAGNLTGTNTLPDGVLSTNVPLLNAATNTFTGSIIIPQGSLATPSIKFSSHNSGLYDDTLGNLAWSNNGTSMGTLTNGISLTRTDGYFQWGANAGFNLISAGIVGLRGNASTASGWSQLQAGTIALQALASPTTALTYTNQGATGAATYTYRYTFEQGDGTSTDAPAATAVTTASSNGTLTSSNFVQLTLPALPTGATRMGVWRTATTGASGNSATTGKIGTSTTTTFNDQGAAASGTLPTWNSTGAIMANSLGNAMFQTTGAVNGGNIDFTLAGAYADTTNTTRLIFATKNFQIASSGAAGGRVGLAFFGGAPGSVTPVNTSGSSHMYLGSNGGGGAFEGLWLVADNNAGGTYTFLTVDAANTFAQRNGTNAQTFNIYKTFTDASNYGRLSIQNNGSSYLLLTQAAGTSSNNQNIVLNAGGSVYLSSGGGVDRWLSNSSGHFLANLDNTYDFGASGANRVRKAYIGRAVNLPAFTVSTLPTSGSTPPAQAGDEAYVTDATAPTYLATLTGGGAVVVKVLYNGTAWVAD